MNKKSKSTKASKNNFIFNPDISDKEKVKRAKYLTERINELFKNISEWIEDLNDFSLKKTTITIEGEKLTAADIYSGKKLIVSLKPTGLWAFGVNCRIDIKSEKETNIIFDIAKQTAPADWQLIPSEAGKKPKKITKVIFRNLLKRI